MRTAAPTIAQMIRADAEWGRWLPALVFVAICLIGIAGCGENEPASQYDQPASLTSIGPVTFDGQSVVVDYTLRDPDGDEQDIDVGVCRDDGDLPDGRCPTPVEGALSDGTSSLPTNPAGEDVTHRFAWNVGCGRFRPSQNQCLETKVDRSYVFRIQLEDTVSRATSGSFTLKKTFDLDDVPSCDRSAGTIYEACRPGGESS